MADDLSVPDDELEQYRREADESRRRAAGLANGAGDSHARFRLIRFNDIKLATSAYYLVQGLIPREGIVVVWGPPKCGKSFKVFDVAMHIALGWKYRGRRVAPGGVVYVACEGERGLGARAAAFRLRHGIEDSDPNFFLITTPLDLVAEHAQLAAAIKSQAGKVMIVAIVIDTLNRSIVADENSAQDMGQYLRAADAIRTAFSCAVIVIHHCGVDGTRPRGSSALPAFVEAQIAVAKDEGGLITATVEYLKDGAEGGTEQSRLEVVDVGQDDEGQAITSCVVIDASNDAASGERRAAAFGSAGRGLEMLREAVATAGQAPPASNHIPQSCRAVKETLWRDYCDKGGLTSSTDDESRRRIFQRTRTKLLEKGLIGSWDGWVWPA